MEQNRATLERLAGGFLFLLGIAAITEYGLSGNDKPVLDGPTYQAVRQVSVLTVAPNDAVRLFPGP